MAYTTNITTTYAGEFAGEYISAALLSGETLAKGSITIKPNVKYKSVMKTFSNSGSIKDASCGFDAQGTLDLAERVLQPSNFQQNILLCKSDFESDWEAISMGYSAFDSLPAKFSDYLISYASSQVAEFIEQQIWSGAGGADSFEGFASLLGNDGTVNDVAAVGGGITADNVIAELGKVVDAIPSAVYGKEDLAIYVGSDIARKYVRALGGFGAVTNAVDNTGVDNRGSLWYSGGDLSVDGVKIIKCPGMANNTMIAAQKSNLFFGTGLLSDTNQVKVLDMGDLDGSDQVRVVMRFNAGVIHGIGADIVLYA